VLGAMRETLAQEPLLAELSAALAISSAASPHPGSITLPAMLRMKRALWDRDQVCRLPGAAEESIEKLSGRVRSIPIG